MKKQVILTLVALPVLLFYQSHAFAFPAPVASAVEEDEQPIVSPLPDGARVAASEINKNDFYVLGAGQNPPQEQKPTVQNNQATVQNNQATVQNNQATVIQPPMPSQPAQQVDTQKAEQSLPQDDLSDKSKQSPGDKELSHYDDSSVKQTDAPKPVMQSAENVKRAPVDEIMPSDVVRSENQSLSTNPLQQSASNGSSDDVEVIPHKMVHKWEKHHKA